MKTLKLLDLLFEGEVKSFGGDELIEEIYKDAIIWKEKNILNQNEMEIEPNIKIATQKESEIKTYEVNLNKVLDFNNKDILIGTLFLMALNLRYGTVLFKIAKFNPKTKTFENIQEFKDILGDKILKLNVLFGNIKKPGIFLSAFSNKLYIGINPFQENAELKMTIRHELQHAAQVINSIALHYAREFKNPKITELSQIKMIDRTPNIKGAYGVGSNITGLLQGVAAEETSRKFIQSKKETPDVEIQNFIEDLKNDPKWFAYLADDFEYATWKSDTLDHVMRGLIVNYEDFINGILQRINSNLASKNTRRPQSQNFQQENKLQETVNPEFLTKEPTSIADLANLIVKDIIKNPRTFLPFSEANFIETIIKIKPKEFIGSFTTDLTKRLTDYANKKGFGIAASGDLTTPQQRGLGQKSTAKQQASQQRKEKQAARIATQSQIKQRDILAARTRKQQEEEFREETKITPRNPRKHTSDMNFDGDTGRKIVDPEQYRQQFQQWLETKNNQTVSASNLAERKLRNFINYIFESSDLN